MEVISWGDLEWGTERAFWQKGSDSLLCWSSQIPLYPIATSWALQPPAGDRVANSHWDFGRRQRVMEATPCLVALHAQQGPHSPPSPAGTHLRSEPGFLFLLPWGRQRRKGH